MQRSRTQIHLFHSLERYILYVLTCLLFVSSAPPVDAKILLQITGPDDYGQDLDADQGVAMAFTLTQAASNVSITIPTVCVGCSGAVFLMKNAVGPTARLADLIASDVFNPQFSKVLLNGLDDLDFTTNNLVLGPGDYIVVLSMDEGFTGGAAWLGTTTPTITRNGVASLMADLRTENVIQGFPPQSNFNAILGTSRLDILITSDVCGDGSVDLSEACDDGNLLAGDGCSATCTIEPGYICTNQTNQPSVCGPVCGDGFKTPNEQCDDGNTMAGDGCRANCTIERCGDGLKDPQEQCDDGNLTNGDGCNANCTLPQCGNRIVDPGEQCDDGNQLGGDGCSATCKVEICGNGILDPRETCDDGNTTSGDGCRANCTVEVCGDHILDQGEQCDDGNTTGGDGCRANCTIERCGDGVVDPQEQCDDQNTVGGDGCRANCTIERCGDAILDPQEQCDDGNLTNGDGCQANCTLPKCGDGIRDPGEQCDDHNNTVGDGCSASCQLEICGNGILDPQEQCDDGNLISGDGCSGVCVIEQHGGQGCSTGFWKNGHHFRSWKQFLPSQNYGTVFGVRPSFTKTLLGALQQGGGGEKALGRQAVAALLNAANAQVNYAFTVRQVIAKVQQAYAARTFEAVAHELEVENERACPLQRHDDGEEDDDSEDDDHHH